MVGLEDAVFAAETCQEKKSSIQHHERSSKCFLYTLDAAGSFRAALAFLVLAGASVQWAVLSSWAKILGLRRGAGSGLTGHREWQQFSPNLRSGKCLAG